jgi:DNA-binding response OmpR family regulator
MSRLQVLIIDDDPSVGRLLRRNFKKLGADPAVRADGEAGLAFLMANHVDLVCLDLMLPNRSGFAICEAIRKSPRNSKVPVLVISARASPDSRAYAEQAGCNGYLVKPFRRSDLEKEVRRLLAAPEQAPEWSGLGIPVATRDV